LEEKEKKDSVTNLTYPVVLLHGTAHLEEADVVMGGEEEKIPGVWE